MERLNKLIQEAIVNNKLSKKGCGCGCNTCHLTENKDKFPHEVKSTKYWEDLLKNTNGISPSTYKTFKNIIDSIKKQNNMASDKQMEELKRLKNGDWKRGSKN